MSNLELLKEQSVAENMESKQNSNSPSTSPEPIEGTPLVIREIEGKFLATVGKYKVYEHDDKEELIELVNCAYLTWEEVGKALAAQHDYFQNIVEHLQRQLEIQEGRINAK